MIVVMLSDDTTSCVMVGGSGESDLSVRPARYFDLRCLLLAAIFEGADYGHLILGWLRDNFGVHVPIRTGYRILHELWGLGYVEFLLDGDVLGSSDEWVRRIFRLTPSGRAHLRVLLSLYGRFRVDDV